MSWPRALGWAFAIGMLAFAGCILGWLLSTIVGCSARIVPIPAISLPATGLGVNTINAANGIEQLGCPAITG